jgi:broad-specificity NMP kinase
MVVRRVDVVVSPVVVTVECAVVAPVVVPVAEDVVLVLREDVDVVVARLRMRGRRRRLNKKKDNFQKKYLSGTSVWDEQLSILE